ncbi:N-6 DNA methylase [Candidatus Poribacteria bacterium]|nr:N-6 DNA methylase [Candidatus Poribacteria bacterium]
MKKPKKLGEKPTRISDTRQKQLGEIIPQYLREVEPLNNEQARSHRFAALLQQLFDVNPNFIDGYVKGIEQFLTVRQKDRILKGKADNLFGNVIIEFESNIPKKRTEAEGQLRRYTAILWSQESPDARTPYLCIATDGVRFVTYSPKLSDGKAKDVAPDDVILEVLESPDWTQLKPEEVFYWLDRYFFRKTILCPTSEMIVRDFGVRSHAFRTTMNSLLTLWREIKTQSAFVVVYDGWEKYLRIVYGSEVAGDELFVRHTYLATLAKLMSWLRIGKTTGLPGASQIIEMIEGRLFKNQGIENFIEEDFFSWLARSEAVTASVGAVRWLFSLLQNYNLRELSEDVLKSLYQELVDPKTRHDLGEFYTPDWLAHRLVRKLLDENPRGSLLDPACGSGTFLYLAIREKRERLKDSAETLGHLLESVCGVDIHPLAVVIAKTNYILALGDLLKKRKGKITIPIYLADTMNLPEPWAGDKTVDYEVRLNGRQVYLPEELLKDLALCDRAIDLSRDYALQNKGKPISLEGFTSLLKAQRFPRTEDEAFIRALFGIAVALKHFIDADRDSIWAFVLKNIYKPLFFRSRFDFVVGNPPWVSFRYAEPSYQSFLRQQITETYELLAGRGELITHLELGTLFLVRAADLYLKAGGTIAFVLPRSLFSADQHDGLRKGSFKLNVSAGQSLLWREVWDCENIVPLFNVPSCVLIAEKSAVAETKYPIMGQILNGKLYRKNASLEEAEISLQVDNVEISLHQRGKRSFWGTGKAVTSNPQSFYWKWFTEGATIVPRSFWFVHVKSSPLGFDPDLPPLETDPRATEKAKASYQDAKLDGNVERDFLYGTILSTDLLPFGHLAHRMVILPLKAESDHFRIIDAHEAHSCGFMHLKQWLDSAEAEWIKRRKSKAEGMNIYERLDRVHGLTRQNPQKKYLVLYPMSATNMCATVKKRGRLAFKIGDQRIKAAGFIVDYKLFYMETDDEGEAYYLASLLNARTIDNLVKPMQSRGLWGPRDICKKVLELPIPKFNANDDEHLRLVELGVDCSMKVDRWLASGGAGEIQSIGKLRGLVREMLKEELKDIDEVVKKIIE